MNISPIVSKKASLIELLKINLEHYLTLSDIEAHWRSEENSKSRNPIYREIVLMSPFLLREANGIITDINYKLDLEEITNIITDLNRYYYLQEVPDLFPNPELINIDRYTKSEIYALVMCNIATILEQIPKQF